MSEDKGKYGLARFNPTDPIFKRVRKDASTDAENLEDKRLEFGRERIVLAEIVKRIQALNAKPAATLEEQRSVDLETQQLYTIASLKGLSGLYDGLGLIADMNSVAMKERDPETKERIYYRIPTAEMLFDLCSYFEELIHLTKKQNKMLHDIGVKQGAFWAGRGGVNETEDTRVSAEEHAQDLESPAPVGVPESKIQEKKTVTREQLEKEIKG